MKYLGAHMLEFPQHGDERGHLVIVEGQKDIPFDIKRIFYIYGSDESVVRGQHANRRTQFVLINVAGKCKVRVCDGKGNESVFLLNRPCGRRCMTLARIPCCFVSPANTMMRMSI